MYLKHNIEFIETIKYTTVMIYLIINSWNGVSYMLLNGKETCNCKKNKCERHGKCDECVEYHKTNKRKPYCMRKEKDK